MDAQSGRGSSGPLQAVSPERINQQQSSTLSTHSFGASVASVTDKITQFNSLATQSKQLERKTADAALKRAMVGREEAEADMRRYREEARQLRKQLEEGRERERRVGERLEGVMENYGRTKETHAHTQALWEKEIRRARKETFKSQSAIVKLQEELKAARASTKAAEEALVYEKERSKTREQEAFQARYELVGCQEELQQTLQKVKMLEQERDAFRSLAKSEEDVARIASEGRLPLPPPSLEEEEEELKEKSEDADADADADAKDANDTKTANDTDKMDETEDNSSDRSSESDGEQVLTVPKQRANKRLSGKGRRVSSLVDIKSSAASEAEIEELTRLWQWEKQRADRSSELVEYLEAECHLRACSCMKKRPRTGILDSARKRPALDIGDGGDRIILSENAALASPTAKIRASLSPKKLPASSLSTSAMVDSATPEQADDHSHGSNSNSNNLEHSPRQSPKNKALRLSTTVFLPEEGIFRTMSQQISEEMEEAVAAAADATIAAMPEEPTAPELTPSTVEHKAAGEKEEAVEEEKDEKEDEDQAPAAAQDPDTTAGTVTTEQPMYARTPSVEPPAYAQTRTSLLSLLDAPHRQEAEQPINFYVPTTPGPAPADTRTKPSVRDSNANAGANADANSSSCMEMDMASKEEEEADDEQPVRRAAASILVSSTSAHDMDDTEMGDEVEDDGEITEEIEQSRVSDVTYSRSTQGAPPQQEYAWYRQQEQQEQQAKQEQHVTERGRESRPDAVEARSHRYETPSFEPAPQRLGRPHTVTGSVFSTKTATTTTKVPLREETTDPSLAQRIMAAQRTPQNRIFSASGESDDSGVISDGPSFDVNNPALTPTMTREECLAQIKERRVRARSAAGGSSSSSAGSRSASGSGPHTSAGVTKPGSGGKRRPVTPGRERRDVSAPIRRVASGRRGRM